MNLKSLFQRPEAKAEELTINQFLERLATQGMAGSGQSVTPANAMRCTTVHGIVRALTNAIGSYPPTIGVMKSSEAGNYVEEMPRHNLNRLLKKPNTVQSSTEFFRMVMKHAALYGNFYAIKGQAQTGPIASLRPIEDPDMVAVDDINWTTGVTYRVQFDGQQQFIHQRNMLHVTSGIMDEDGVTGKSPVLMAKEAIGICLAAENLMANLYGNNSVPTLVLKGGKFQNQEQYETWSKGWKEWFGARGERGGTALMPEGMEPHILTFSPVDAQVLEMRKFQQIEIAGVYGVPPHRLGILDRATFSNIEEQSLEFVRDVAKPWVKLIEQAMMRDLLTDADQNAGVVVRFDMEQATEGKLKERLEAYEKAYMVGAMNPNEIRQKIGEDPRTDEGGEAYVTPLNMRTTDDPVDNDT